MIKKFHSLCVSGSYPGRTTEGISYEVTGELRKIGSAKGKDLVIRRYIWGLFKKVATFAQIRWARYHYIYAILCYIEEKIRVSLIEDSSRGRKTGWGSCIFSYFSNVSEIAWTFLKHCWNMKKKDKIWLISRINWAETGSAFAFFG